MSTILVTYENTIQIISFNRPKKLNAISYKCFNEVSEALREGAQKESVFLTILTGIGKTYSTGVDLLDISNVDVEEHLNATRNFVRAFIDYPKLLVALVNGPAIGIACTTLGLCDLVYASKKATFSCPFHSMGITAEGCSTVTFPLIMGKTRAVEFLYSGKILNAYDAQNIGLVNEVISDGIEGKNQLTEKLRNKIAMYKLPVMSTKSIMFGGAVFKDELHKANDREIEKLREIFKSDDFNQVITNYIKRTMFKNKL